MSFSSSMSPFPASFNLPVACLPACIAIFISLRCAGIWLEAPCARPGFQPSRRPARLCSSTRSHPGTLRSSCCRGPQGRCKGRCWCEHAAAAAVCVCCWCAGAAGCLPGSNRQHEGLGECVKCISLRTSNGLLCVFALWQLCWALACVTAAMSLLCAHMTIHLRAGGCIDCMNFSSSLQLVVWHL